MQVSFTRRRGLLRVTSLVGVMLVASTGLTAVAKPVQSNSLRQQVEAIHRTGAVGVSAEVTSSGSHDSARAGTARIGATKPMPENGRFRIGSATKTFTATVVLQLVGEGRISLDDTVEQWLPGVVQGNGLDGSRITVRQLLQHTSGIPDVPVPPALRSADGYRAERFRTYTPRELVRAAMRQPAEPSEVPGWSYSNTNYVLAAMIIREVTGRSWQREVHDRIIRPLALRDTAAPGTFPFIPGPHAHAYAGFGTDTGVDVTTLDPSMAVGSGSVISSTRDLNRFYAALLAGRLMRPEQLDEMTTTVPAPGLGASYGLGLAEIRLSCGGSYFGHRGELLGYVTWAGTTGDGDRTASVYVTSHAGQDTEESMTELVDQQLCGAQS